MIPLLDPFGRAIQYLRVSLTDRCNLRCTYCMPEGGVPYAAKEDTLTADEILRLVTLLAQNGLQKVRLTGGEPLVRADVVDITRRIAQIPAITDLGLTTNAVLLARHAQDLWDAGLRRLNISLDTLQPDRFARIARFQKFSDAWQGLETALATGFSPIKLNMVVMRGVNDDEVCELAELAVSRPLHVRFLEYMPIGEVTPWDWKAQYVPNSEVLERLRSRFSLTPLPTASSSTAQVFTMAGAPGTVGVINPISHRFCDGCNRLRLTANGSLVPCLSDNYEYPLMPALRSGATDAQLLTHVRAALLQKPKQSDFEGRAERGGSLRIMAQIGG